MEEKYNREHLFVHPLDYQFRGSDKDEPVICRRFGCGRELSTREMLFGEFCIHCQSPQKINPNKVISYPVKNMFGNIKK